MIEQIEKNISRLEYAVSCGYFAKGHIENMKEVLNFYKERLKELQK